MEMLADSQGVATLLIFVVLVLREVRGWAGGTSAAQAEAAAADARAAADRLQRVHDRMMELRAVLPADVIRKHSTQIEDMHRMVREIHIDLMRRR